MYGISAVVFVSPNTRVFSLSLSILVLFSHDSGSSSHPSMLVKSGFSLRRGGASSTDKDSVTTTREFEEHSIEGTASLTMMDDNDSLFRESNIADLPPVASHTRTSLGHTATLVSLGGSRVSFGELRQQSVPTMLGAGGRESGFPIEEEKEGEEEGVEHGSEATPREQGGEEMMLYESQSTLKGSFGYASQCTCTHS